jgi:CubicO group peptidase (beta-lactamase class C family)
MKQFLLIIFTIQMAYLSKAQTNYFPPVGVTNQWDSISINSLGWCQDKLDTLLYYLENKNTKAFIVLKDGKIVIEKYFGTFTMDSIWYWASAGKSLTSFAVGIAQQENFLSIQDATSTYLGTSWTIAPTNKEQLITLKHQLSMTTGLDDGVPDHHCTLDTCLAYLADAGTRWAYHNGPYTLLDSVIESATGQNLNSYVNQKISLPTGITGQFIQNGFNNIFISKPRSMARYGLLILNKGKWNNTTLLSDTNYFNEMTNSSQLLNPAYGYLWWLNGKTSFLLPGLQIPFNGSLCPNAPSDMIAAMGKNGQFLNVVPSQKLVWVRMGNEPGGSEVPAFLNDSIWRRLNAVMCVPSATSKSELNETTQIFPNPAHNYFYVRTSLPHFDLVITDMFGRKILYKPNLTMNDQISTLDLASGLYLVKVQHNGKLIKQERVSIY